MPAPASLADLLAAPHVKSLVDIGEAAPVVIVTPLRVVLVERAGKLVRVGE